MNLENEVNILYIIDKETKNAIIYIDDEKIRILENDKYALLSDAEWRRSAEKNNGTHRSKTRKQQE